MELVPPPPPTGSDIQSYAVLQAQTPQHQQHSQLGKASASAVTCTIGGREGMCDTTIGFRSN